MFAIRKEVPFKCLRVSRVFFSKNCLLKEDKIKIGRYEVNYLKVGEGPHKVFCAPGILGTIWTEFKPQIEGFEKDKFTLIVWDPPGYGKSYPPEKEFPVDLFEKDADAAYELMKVLQVPKFSLLGFSDGGIMSLIIAAKYPDAVNKLVVWGSHSFILPHELEVYKNLRDISKWSKWILEPLIEVYGKERLFKYVMSLVDVKETIYHTNKGNICSDLLKNIKCPTYILHGEKDPMVDRVHASHLHTHISRSRIHLYPEGKHHVHMRYADDFNKRVQEFLLQE